MDVST